MKTKHQFLVEVFYPMAGRVYKVCFLTKEANEWSADKSQVRFGDQWFKVIRHII